ncbi:hypothetical protein AU476_14115 [Cupriavidus sp. UYMSc13B]|nr:hypothetical protein AU476_14115 [Cupriavidus sp. UYMSc13B]
MAGDRLLFTGAAQLGRGLAKDLADTGQVGIAHCAVHARRFGRELAPAGRADAQAAADRGQVRLALAAQAQRRGLQRGIANRPRSQASTWRS